MTRQFLGAERHSAAPRRPATCGNPHAVRLRARDMTDMMRQWNSARLCAPPTAHGGIVPIRSPTRSSSRILDNARFAPSGGNRQGWRVIVVRDAGIRASLGELFRKSWYEFHAPLFTASGKTLSLTTTPTTSTWFRSTLWS